MGRTGRQDATGTYEKILLYSDLVSDGYGSYAKITELAKQSKSEIETYLNAERTKKILMSNEFQTGLPKNVNGVLSESFSYLF